MQNFESDSNFFSSVSEISNIYYLTKFKKYINNNYNILDFGCGSGEFLELINCKYKCGIEINKFSQNKLLKKQIPYYSNLDKIKKKKFNIIFALSVIDHLLEPSLVIQKLSKKLKTGGKIIFIIRHDDKKQTTKNSSYKKHFYSWSLLSFSNFISELNFEIIECNTLKMTIVPKFIFLRKLLSLKIILILSKIYFYFNFKDRRFYFVCKKK